MRVATASSTAGTDPSTGTRRCRTGTPGAVGSWFSTVRPGMRAVPLGVGHLTAYGNGLTAPVDLHPAPGVGEWGEADPGVHVVRVGGGEHESAYAEPVQVVPHDLDEPTAQALAALGRRDVDVAEPAEGRAVGHRPRESDLLGGGGVDTEALRALDRAGHHVKRPAESPVRVGTEPAVDARHVQPRHRRIDLVPVVAPLPAGQSSLRSLMTRPSTQETRLTMSAPSTAAGQKFATWNGMP